MHMQHAYHYTHVTCCDQQYCASDFCGTGPSQGAVWSLDEVNRQARWLKSAALRVWKHQAEDIVWTVSSATTTVSMLEEQE